MRKLKKLDLSDLLLVLAGFVIGLVLTALGASKNILVLIAGITIMGLALLHLRWTLERKGVEKSKRNIRLVLIEVGNGLMLIIAGLFYRPLNLLIIVGIGSILLGLLHLGWMVRVGLIKPPKK